MKKLFPILALILLLALTGCNMFESLSDDSSSEAELEEAQMALNDGDYQKVIDMLAPGFNASNPDPATTRLLASAYMGRAGFDLTYILENSDQDEDRESLDVITSALHLYTTTDNAMSESVEYKSLSGSTPLYIDIESVIVLFSNIEEAQRCLQALVNAYGDDDDKVQLGIVSAVHFILEIGLVAAEATSTEVVTRNLPINKYAYREIFPTGGNTTVADLTAFAASITGDTDLLSSLKNDLTYVSTAVDVLILRAGADEDISEEFNDFLKDLFGLDRSVTSSDINALTGTILKTYLEAKTLGYSS